MISCLKTIRRRLLSGQTRLLAMMPDPGLKQDLAARATAELCRGGEIQDELLRHRSVVACIVQIRTGMHATFFWVAVILIDPRVAPWVEFFLQHRSSWRVPTAVDNDRTNRSVPRDPGRGEQKKQLMCGNDNGPGFHDPDVVASLKAQKSHWKNLQWKEFALWKAQRIATT